MDRSSFTKLHVCRRGMQFLNFKWVLLSPPLRNWGLSTQHLCMHMLQLETNLDSNVVIK